MQFKQKLRDLFCGNFVEINKNHNEILTTIHNYYDKINTTNVPILVNYDSHSDIYINTQFDSENLNIGNWVNYAVTKYDIEEIYWILPHYIENNILFNKTEISDSDTCIINGPLTYQYPGLDKTKINKVETYLYKDKYEIITLPKFNRFNQKCKKFGIDGLCNDLRKITIYIISLKNIDILQNKNIILSIDADAFCNSGFDTEEMINNKDISSAALLNEFEFFITSIYNSGLKPFCTSLTRSPAYFPKKFENEINTFFNEIKEASVCDTLK